MSEYRYHSPGDHAVDINTILAALRFYQEGGQGEPANRSLDIHDLATNGDEQISMDANGIDELCEAINMGHLVLVDAARARHVLDDVFDTLVANHQGADDE
jgi:hypothetical protein